MPVRHERTRRANKQGEKIIAIGILSLSDSDFKPPACMTAPGAFSFASCKRHHIKSHENRDEALYNSFRIFVIQDPTDDLGYLALDNGFHDIGPKAHSPGLFFRYHLAKPGAKDDRNVRSDAHELLG